MNTSFNCSLRIQFEYQKPIPLTQFDSPIDFLKDKRGVYFLHQGSCSESSFDPYSKDVIYIGKAIGETIFSRCQKHLYSITAAAYSNGNPKTNPGKRFKEYREKIGGKPDDIYVIPGFMDVQEPYLISCAEEYLLFYYKKQNNELPKANTK